MKSHALSPTLASGLTPGSFSASLCLKPQEVCICSPRGSVKQQFLTYLVRCEHFLPLPRPSGRELQVRAPGSTGLTSIKARRSDSKTFQAIYWPEACKEGLPPSWTAWRCTEHPPSRIALDRVRHHWSPTGVKTTFWQKPTIAGVRGYLWWVVDGPQAVSLPGLLQPGKTCSRLPRAPRHVCQR